MYLKISNSSIFSQFSLIANFQINFWAGTSCLTGLRMADLERGHRELSETPLTFRLRPIVMPPRAAQKLGTLDFYYRNTNKMYSKLGAFLWENFKVELLQKGQSAICEAYLIFPTAQIKDLPWA